MMTCKLNLSVQKWFASFLNFPFTISFGIFVIFKRFRMSHGELIVMASPNMFLATSVFRNQIMSDWIWVWNIVWYVFNNSNPAHMSLLHQLELFSIILCQPLCCVKLTGLSTRHWGTRTEPESWVKNFDNGWSKLIF